MTRMSGGLLCFVAPIYITKIEMLRNRIKNWKINKTYQKIWKCYPNFQTLELILFSDVEFVILGKRINELLVDLYWEAYNGNTIHQISTLSP